MEFLTRRSWDTCETTACSPLDRLTGPKHLQPSAKFSMRCGSSTRSLNERLPGSTRSRRDQKVEAGRSIGCEVSTATPPSERTEDAPSRLTEFLHRRRDAAADDVPAFRRTHLELFLPVDDRARREARSEEHT